MTSKYEGSDTKCNHGQACASVLPVFKLVDNHDFCFPAYGEQSDVIRAESWLSSQTVKCCGDPWEQYFLLSPSNKTQNTNHKADPWEQYFLLSASNGDAFFEAIPAICASLWGAIYSFIKVQKQAVKNDCSVCFCFFLQELLCSTGGCLIAWAKKTKIWIWAFLFEGQLQIGLGSPQ